MKLQAHITSYITMADTYLSNLAEPLERSAIASGRDAWSLAHKAGITQHAYALSRDIYDAHIQTALGVVFPNAIFKDKKVY